MVKIKIYKCKKFITREKKDKAVNGLMIPLWKNFAVPKIKPKFIYYTTCAPNKIKGPYLHKKRRGLLSLIDGRAIFVYENRGRFKELYLDATKNYALMLDIPPKLGYLLKNPYAEEAKFVNICDYAWRKGNQETTAPDFSDYLKKHGKRKKG